MAAVRQHRELDARRAPELEQRVDRGADRAAGVEDVVDEDHRPVDRIEGERRVADYWRVPRGAVAADVDVVAVERDVELPERQLHAGALGDKAPEALRERHAPRVDPDERDLVEVVAALDDLV